MLRHLLVTTLVCGWTMCADAQAAKPLFVLERSTNGNVIHYDAHILVDGKLDLREPVAAYWVMASDGRRQSLTWLEKTKAYGFEILTGASRERLRMALVSQPGREITIHADISGVRAETTIEGRRAVLQRIFVHTRRSGLMRTADSYEMFGVDVETGRSCYEKIVAH